MKLQVSCSALIANAFQFIKNGSLDTHTKKTTVLSYKQIEIGRFVINKWMLNKQTRN